jgi:hypothetical protein
MYSYMTSCFLLTASVTPAISSCATEIPATENFLTGVIQLTQQGTSLSIPETTALLQELQQKGVVLKKGADAELRPAFVGAQLDIERYLTLLLRMGKISQVDGIIHTPAPATPLCKTIAREIPSGLVASQISEDEKRAYTVKERAIYLREYLASGGKLVVAYPKEGRKARSEKELAIFDAELKKYSTLIDKPLSIDSIPEELQGATYSFLDDKGNLMIFSIRSYQANDPKDGREWGIWFGPASSNPDIQERLSAISKLI